jgi:hypothetical protein
MKKHLNKIIALFAAGGLVIGGYHFGSQSKPRPRIMLYWTNPMSANTNAFVEIWATTNLHNWNLKTTIPSSQTNIYFPTTEIAEFFRLRNALVSGSVTQYSGWNQ